MKKKTHIAEIDMRRIGLTILIIFSVMFYAAIHTM